ncbi:MAG: hypothetical protein WBP93_15910 [Pyrinomonadaceae bacterium]
MSPLDHNKTLAILYTLMGGYFALPILASPFVIAFNIDSFLSPRSGTLVLIATIAILGVLLFLALLHLSTAFSLYKRKQRGRTLALISAVFSILLCPPLAVYTWWFMHSEGGKQLYSVPEE